MPEAPELLERWQRGDPEAGEQLVQMHFEPLLRFVRSKIDDRSAVDDIVQETWAAVVVQRGRLQIRTTFRHYLVGIAAHKVFKYLRLRLGAREVELPSMSIEQLAPSLGGVVDAKGQQKLLVAGLRSLPLEQQIILELYVWEEMPTKEIAELLGLSITQVKHRIREGKARLDRFVQAAGRGEAAVSTDALELTSWMSELQKLARPDVESPEPAP